MNTYKKIMLLGFALMILPLIVMAQELNISGRITDSNGDPLVGASVVVKGTTIGVTTGINGDYNISAPPDAALTFSFLGMGTKEEAVGGRARIDVAMDASDQTIEEVVVMGFGLSQKKATLTGAVSSVGAEDIGRSSAATASGALVGKMAGINTRQTDGRPGSSTGLNIRNYGDPLYVIDGIVSDGGQFNNLDFNDIESVNILKDASAALYGVRAANGVVVVTTKKGKQGQRAAVGINTYYGWQNISNFARPSSAIDYIEHYIQAQTYDRYYRNSTAAYNYTQDDLAKWKEGKEYGYRPFDWYEYIWNTAPQYYVSGNVSGGTEKTNYYVSLGRLSQDAMIKGFGGFYRTNAQMSIDTRISSRLKVGASMNGRIESRVNPGLPGWDDYWLPRFGTYRNLPTKRPFANDNPNYPAKTSSEIGTNFALSNYNISGKMMEDWRVMQLSANAEYNIWDGLKARALAGYYYANRWFTNHEFTYKIYDYNPETDEYFVVDQKNDNYYNKTTEYKEDYTANLQLSYDKKFGAHTVSAVVGMDLWHRDEPYWGAEGQSPLNSINDDAFDNYANITLVWSDGRRPKARLGYIGRFNYDFGNKYLFEVLGRYDGSYRFPSESRWGFFPAGSVGWRISEEGFWKNRGRFSQIWSDLKLRASYGITGDDGLGGYNDFDYLGGYNYGNGSAVLDGDYIVGIQPRGLPVTNLTWMEAKTLDIGFDAGFFNNRLTGQFDFFRRLRTGLTGKRYDVLIPDEVGFGLPVENLNSDLYMGFEWAAKWSEKINVLGSDLHYSAGGNLTYSRFYDWEQYKPRFSNSWDYYRNSINHRFGYINWALESIGQFESWEQIANYPVDMDRQGNKTIMPGDLIYKDVNGDGLITGLDERPMGYRRDGLPIMNFGINLAAQWKGFDIAMDFTGGGFYTYTMDWETKLPFHDNGNYPTYMNDSWHYADIWNANSELIKGKYPMLRLGERSSSYWNSNFWKRNVTYVKLRNLELGYNLPKWLLDKMKMQGFRLYVSGTNLFTLSSIMDIGIDPEVQDENGLAYPNTRIINIGLNLKF